MKVVIKYDQETQNKIDKFEEALSKYEKYLWPELTKALDGAMYPAAAASWRQRTYDEDIYRLQLKADIKKLKKQAKPEEVNLVECERKFKVVYHC